MRRRPGISAGHRALSWAARRMNVSAGPATVPTCEPPAPPPARISHPAIQAPSYKCYRVIRRFIVGDADRDSIEDIGAFRDAGPAMAMVTRERGRAQVLDPNGKVYSDNLQPREVRA